MSSWYNWFIGKDEVEADERQKQLRHVLHQQVIKNSNFTLRPVTNVKEIKMPTPPNTPKTFHIRV